MHESTYDFSLASFLLEIVFYLSVIFFNNKLIKRVSSKNFTTCDSYDCLRCQLKTKQLCKETYTESFDEVEILQKNGQIMIPSLVLSNQHFLEKKCYDKNVKLLESNWEVLLQECMQILPNADNFNKCWKENKTPNGCWSVFYLYNQGKKIENNLKFCPKTDEIINKLNNVNYSKFGNVCFSMIKPNTAIPEHCGPTNARIRCHLGLQIPTQSSDCTITVGGTKKFWIKGKCLLFDDSLPHCVQYSSKYGEYRIVFLVDFWHYKL